MISSPQNGPEFENAIRETLVQGEELISFANGWIHTEMVGVVIVKKPDDFLLLIHSLT